MADQPTPDPLPRFLLVALLATLLGLGGAGLAALQAARRADAEFEAKASLLPKTFAIANANAIVRGDVAALRGAVEGLFKGSVGTEAGLLYAVILDPDGEPLAVRFADDVPPFLRARMDARLRVARENGEGAEHRSAREQLGLAPGAAAAAETTAYRHVGAFQLTTVDADTLPYLDVAVPVVVSNANWGAIRMGFRDLHRADRYARWAASGATLLFVLAASAVLAVLSGRTVADRFVAFHEGEVAALKRKFERAMADLKAQEPSSGEAPLQPQEFFALLDAAKDLGSTLDEDEILATALRACVGLLHARDISIFFLDPATNQLVGRAGHAEGGDLGPEVMRQVTVPVGHGEIGMAAEFGTTAVVDDPRPGSGVVSALIARGQTLGVILARNKTTGRPFLKRDRLIMRLLAQFTANALAASWTYRAAAAPVENR